MMKRFTPRPSQDSLSTALLEMNKSKNRYNEVIPPEEYRVKSPNLLVAGDSDYINAIYVDGFRQSHQYIMTQTPLKVFPNNSHLSYLF